MDKLIVKTCTQTCSACPSQWDLYTQNDEYIYIRFRWGNFSAVLNAFTDNEINLFHWYDQDAWNGFMDTETMANLLSNVLDFSHCVFDND